jgi:macrolide-specific efflux system membrane fusion protein
MTIQSQVSEADVSRLKVGMDVYFTTLGNGQKRWQGKLRQINPTPEIVNNVVLYNALFDVANPDGALMTQMTAQIFFVVAKADDALVVPLAALRPAGGPAGSAKAGRSSGAGNAKGKGAARTRTDVSASSATDPRTQFAGGRARVRVMNADGSTQAREVQIGAMDRVSAQVLSGLEAGEQVVVGQRSSAPASAPPARSATQSMMPRGRI